MFGLQCISHYSIGDSSIKLDKLIKAAQKANWPAIGLIENHTLSSVVDFTQTCPENIKPIIGCRYNTDSGYTVTLIATNHEGYINLVKILGKSYVKDGKSVVKVSDIKSHADGLILLMGGVNDLSEISTDLASYFTTFVTDKKLAKHSKRPVLSVQPIVYVERTDAILTQVVFCDGRSLTMHNWQEAVKTHFIPDLFTNLEYYVKPTTSYDPNIMQLADLCERYSVTQSAKIPIYENGKDSKVTLRELCRAGWRKRNLNRYKSDSVIYDAYAHRIQNELKVFETAKASLPDYILLVLDIIKFCKDHHTTVKLRGSASACLISYLIGISDIDPVWPDKSLPYHMGRSLIFERFFNAARANAMPDIDIDVCPNIREKLKKFITEKYGTSNVSQNIVTFSRYDGRAALKTVFRVFETMSSQEVDHMTAEMINKDKISDELEDIRQSKPDYTTIEYNLDNIPQFQANMESNQKELDIAIRLSDIIFTSGKHAAGTVISPTAIAETFPTIYTKDGTQIIGLEMEDAEAAGAVKYDLLCVAAYEKIDQIKSMVLNKRVTVDENILIGNYEDVE